LIFRIHEKMQFDNKLSNSNAPQKILLISAGRIGDTLFCTPAIRLLKESLPNVDFDLLAFSKLAGAIFERNPHIHKLYVENNPSAIRRIVDSYPLTINLMIETLKKIPTPPQNYISIELPDLTKHRTAQLIEFIKSILENPSNNIDYEYQIFPLEEDKKKVIRLLAEQKVCIGKDILIGCQLGCHRVAGRGWKIWNRQRHRHKKVWSMENYIDLAKRICSTNSKIKFILTGSPSERYLAKMFLKGFPSAIDLIGKTSLHELTALMELLNVLVTNDTGTMHLACARKTPIVALFGSTAPPAFTGPYPMQPQYHVISKKQIGDIHVIEVYDALKVILL